MPRRVYAREEILLSEKAFAYKMKLEAMKHQGKRVDIEENTTSDPMGWKLESANKTGAEVGESMTNLRRYIRLTHLIPDLLEQERHLTEEKIEEII